VHLTWKFRATVKDLGSPHTLAPLSVITFSPAGLDLRNDAKPGTSTPLRHTIQPGQRVSKDAIKSVRVQASYDDGRTWHTVPVSGKIVNWLARIKDPTSGFVASVQL
jgi:hypothetical protein